jgi:hypothetical protein
VHALLGVGEIEASAGVLLERGGEGHLKKERGRPVRGAAGCVDKGRSWSFKETVTVMCSGMTARTATAAVRHS